MKNRVYPFYFTLGALLLYLIFVVLPGFMGIAYSFTDWNSYTTEVNFIGLDNFKTILSASENYLGYIQNTLLFTVWTIALKTVIALFLAVLLNYDVRRLSHLYRVIIYLPVVLPTIAVGLVFRSILNPRSGILNEFLRSIGLEIGRAHV